MNLGALVQYGYPPIGKGIYVRNRVDGLPPADFHIVVAWRNDAPDQARALNAKWLFGGPEHFLPTNYREGIDFITRRCNALGIPGFFVDFENGWRDLTAADRANHFRVAGAMLSERSKDFRIVITSFPMLASLEILAEAAGDGCAGSPQIYGISANTAAEFRRWWNRWVQIFGEGRIIPSVALWESTSALGTAEGYRAYLDRIPAAQGAAGWTTGTPPHHQSLVFQQWQPGGSTVGTYGLAARNWILRPAGATVAALVVILIALAAVGIGAMRRG